MASTTQFPSGTISQNEVARIFVDAGIAKHNTRIDVLFLKAVRTSFTPHLTMC
jgi:hypothetical protein